MSELEQDLSAAFKEGIVEAAVTIHAARQAMRAASGESRATFPLGTVLFDLAKLHTRMLGDLAKFSHDQASTMLGFLESRRRERGGAAERAPTLTLADVKMTLGQPATSSFQLRNDGTAAQSYLVPAVIEACPLGGDDDPRASAFIAIEAEPALVTVAPGKRATVTLTIKSSVGLAAGRYRARMPLQPAEPASANVELIVEIDVAAPSTSPPARAT